MPARDNTPGRHDNFDTLRLLAAILVLVSHAMLLVYGTNDHDFLHRISGGATFLGALAVDVFFAMSGYLIAGSYLRSGKPRAFVAARAARILPALYVVVVIEAFVIGPLATALPTNEYFASADTWRFVWRNLLMWGAVDLPGVFPQNPLHGVANGSIWTLVFEVECYAVILCVGLLDGLSKYRILLPWVLSLVASAFWFGEHFGPFLAVFMGGALMQVWRPPLTGWVALLCALIWGAGLVLPGYRLFTAIFGVYVILFLALSPSVRLPHLGRFGDMSYGLYVWAFPVQQCIVMTTGTNVGWYWNVAISLPITLGLAAVSWHYIEAPCLRLKKRYPLPGGVVPNLAASVTGRGQ